MMHLQQLQNFAIS